MPDPAASANSGRIARRKAWGRIGLSCLGMLASFQTALAIHPRGRPLDTQTDLASFGTLGLYLVFLAYGGIWAWRLGGLVNFRSLDRVPLLFFVFLGQMLIVLAGLFVFNYILVLLFGITYLTPP